MNRLNGYPETGLGGFFYGYMSNFYPSPVSFDGLHFPTIENAFQAAKTTDLSERIKFTEVGPSQAKQFGRKVKPLRSDWEQIKDGVMLDLLRQKFACEPLRSALLDTENQHLIEFTTWHDTYWGVCLGGCKKGWPPTKDVKPHEPGIGQNKLGLMIEQVRSELQRSDRFTWA